MLLHSAISGAGAGARMCMTNQWSFGRPENESENAAMARALAQSFGFEEERARRWMQSAGEDTHRVLRRGGRVAATLVLVDMGQFFGGHRVPMGGIAGVAVPPEERGAGAALNLMIACLRELRERGVPISTLYPATQTLYRRAGYEQAGSWFEITVPTAAIHVREKELEIRPATREDQSILRDLYLRRAVHCDGMLDRGTYIWDRVWEFRGEKTLGFIVHRNGQAEGHVFYLQRRPAVWGRFDLQCTDLVATTPAAARRILSFLADHRSMAQNAIWFGGPTEPILAHLPERTFEVKLNFYWMIRIVDVAGALSARGYPARMKETIRFEITDDVLPENSGRYVLRIEGGRGVVERDSASGGGAGRLRMDVRALASLFSGFRSPAELILAGQMTTDDPQMAQAAGWAFASVGGGPAMCDMF